jgi:hypothetical protein
MVARTFTVAALAAGLGMAAGTAIAAPATQPSSKIEPAAIADFFVTPDHATKLVWKAPADLADRHFQVTDYWGNLLQSGEAAVSDGKLRAELNLPAGFYQVHFVAPAQDFGVVAVDKPAGPADPFFGMDAVLSWLEQRPGMRAGLINAMTRSGIAIARERVAWPHINRTPGKWEWDAVDHYQTLRETYASCGLPILEMFHASPAWVRNDDTAPYPGDLVATADAWKTIGGKWRQYWGGLEVWNEPEGGAHASHPAEQYIPTIKTVAYAFAQAGYNVPLGGGVFMGEDPGEYHRSCARNGMLDAVDFVSFHTYHGAPDIQRHVGKYRQWLKENGKEAMPLWITESGEPWPAGTGSGAGADRARQDDDARSGMEIAMKAVESRACGVARYFPFDLPFYVEGPKNFSMMGKDGTPMRSMAAYAQCIAALSGKTYVGDLAAVTPVRLAHVFEQNGQCIAVIYTGKLEKDATVRLAVVPQHIAGIDGRAITANPDGAIPIPDGLVYVSARAADLAPLLKQDTEAARLLAISRQKPPVHPAPSPVVLQFMRTVLPSLHGPDGYLLQPSAAGNLPVRVRAWNLSDQPANLKLAARLPGAPAAAATATSIPPRQSVDLDWRLNATDALDIEQYRYLTVADDAGNGAGAACTPLAIGLRLEGTLDQYLARHPQRQRLAIDDLSAWQKNIAASGTTTFSSPAAGQWRMEFQFTHKTDQWVYPRFRLPNLEGKHVRGVLLRARAMDKAQVRLMVYGAGAKATYWTSQPVIPADAQWHAAWIPVEQFDPLADVNDVGGMDLAKASAISVGMHNGSASNANVLEVSDLYLVWQ